MQNPDVLRSGGTGVLATSARSGFLPIPLERAPREAFAGIPIYLRLSNADAKDFGADAQNVRGEGDSFRLYCAAHVPFSDAHRTRLVQYGVKFIYIPIASQDRFHQQTEAQLLETISDPSVAVSVKSEIVYETSVELMNELLADPILAVKSPRLEKVSRAVTTLVLNNPTSFSHLFAASHHDFYTATHMVNVGTWMVPLAYAMGHHDTDELSVICQAGLLHDIGKTYISPEILNKTGKLTDSDWEALRSHPELGCKHLEQYERIHPLILTVTRQHHERIDGTGYPDKITGDKMHPISKICAVVNSFDAMTAFRPFKTRTMTVDEAMEILMKETPQKYDPEVMEQWVRLISSANGDMPAVAALASKVISATPAAAGKAAPAPAVTPAVETEEQNKRRFERIAIHCPGRVHVLADAADGVHERLGIPVIAHNLSRSGAGFLSQTPVNVGEHVRLYLSGPGQLKRQREGLAVRCRNYRDGWYEMGMHYGALDSVDIPVAQAG